MSEVLKPDTTTLGASLNIIDRALAWLDPSRGIERLAKRHAFNAYSDVKVKARAHESSSAGRMRKFYSDRLGPNAIVSQGAVAIRAQSRHMDRNNDIARGITRTMVNNIIGPNGIAIEPQPRRLDGTIHQEHAADLRTLLRDWVRRPEVTRRFTYSKTQRMACKAWIRDGEVFQQDLIGTVPGLIHSTSVPYSIELFEADFVPMEYNEGTTIVQGIERNAWGAPGAYWVYKGNPLETLTPLGLNRNDLKRIDAARVRHIAFLDHIGQARGISEFASIIARLEDIKDYEESERIAAKVAAMLTAYVKRAGGPEGYDPEDIEKDPVTGKALGRNLNLSPGMIIDGLAPGEEIGLIDSKRPNPNVVTFRQGQLRAAAAGIGASYSSISKSYDGTFSSQRQELVEQWINYATLADDFTGQSVQPTYETLVRVANLSGVLRTPRDVMPGTQDDALFTAQAMPWIDPLKEANAWVMLSRAGFASEIEILRKRGVNPRDFLEQVGQWRKETKDKGLIFTSNAANGATTAPTDGGAPLDDGAAAAAAAAAAAN
jgi:lambda family phage portal protein